MISFNIENLPLQTSLVKFDFAIFTFKNLLKVAVLKECPEKTDMEKVLSYVSMYT